MAGTSMVQDVWGTDCSALHRSGSRGQSNRLAEPAPQALTTYIQALLLKSSPASQHGTTYPKPSVQMYEPVLGRGRG